jgi:hypothetical protein
MGECRSHTGVFDNFFLFVFLFVIVGGGSILSVIISLFLTFFHIRILFLILIRFFFSVGSTAVATVSGKGIRASLL